MQSMDENSVSSNQMSNEQCEVDNPGGYRVAQTLVPGQDFGHFSVFST